MNVATVGLDLAKSVLQVHGVEERGKIRLRKQLRRREVLRFFATLPPCLVGMEACGGAHYWAQRLQECGHTVKLMAPQFVRPYVKTNKTDARDAEAIGEAVLRPTMRFVPVKTPEQQAILALPRARQGCVKARTAQVNQLRSLLAEFGVVLPQGIQRLRQQVPAILVELETKVPELCGTCLSLSSPT
jgi:transposase